jgi:uncharacterized C2H2 Zn-finger protein
MEKKLHCQLCNYNTDRNVDWLRHIKSKLHQRGGQQRIKKCDICNIEFSSNGTYKHHNLMNHSTTEERSKSKYYCDICDAVFIAKIYYDRHMNGIRHKNQEQIKQSLQDIQNIIDKRNQINPI